MTAPTLDLSALPVDDVPEGVPNHRASSGETGEKPRMSTRGPVKPRSLFGRTGGADSNRASNEKPHKDSPPQLKPAMRQQLSDLYQFIGASVRPFDDLTGQTIIDNADKCADSVYKLAQSNDAVRRVIISLTTTSAVGAVVMAHLPIVLALARHSKNETVKAGAMGTFMALKFADAATAESMFGADQDSQAEDGK